MRYKINADYIIQENEDKLIVFDSENSMLYTCNELGTYIFQRLKRKWDEERIMQKISEEYDIDISEIKEDIKEFISTLVKKDIIIPT